jgi:hypothetical protein
MSRSDAEIESADYAEFWEFVRSRLRMDLGREPTPGEIENAIDEGDWEVNCE